MEHRSPVEGFPPALRGWRYWKELLTPLVSTVDGRRYVQTWPNAVRLGRRYPRALRRVQRLCGRLTGHEFSRTERGYDGGRHADRWCRWCNQHFQIPAQECDFAREMGGLLRARPSEGAEGG